MPHDASIPPTPLHGVQGDHRTASRPEFVYFDLGNVLLYFDHELIVRQMAEVAACSEDAVRRAVLDGDLDRRYDRGQIDCLSFYEEFCQRTSTRADYARLRRAVAEIFSVNESMLPMVRALHQQRVQLGILSNTCPPHWEYVSDGRYPFLNECFEQYALSYELRAAKPDAEIYARAAELAGVAPEKIFFVDDRSENITGAREAGYDAVLFTGARQFRDDVLSRGLPLP